MKTILSIFILTSLLSCMRNKEKEIGLSAGRVVYIGTAKTKHLILIKDTTQNTNFTPSEVETEPTELCCEEISPDDGVVIKTYIKQKDIDSSSTKIMDLLKSAYAWADQYYPRSIADDWEHGISYEYGRPNEIKVKIYFFDNCNSEKAYLYMEYTVYTNEKGEFTVK